MDSKIFHKFSYGLYVISSSKEGKLNGQTANTVFQISPEPATVGISINKNNLTHEFIRHSGVFTVSILPKSVPLELIGHFGFKSGRDIDKFQTIPYKLGQTGAPYLVENSLGYLEAEVVGSVDAGTHTIFIGRVVNAEVFSNEEPMTYAYYQQVKRGTTPPKESAQTSGNPGNSIKELKKDGTKAKKYRCPVCGYIYDPEVGDPDSGIAPGTSFKDIPDSWVCPICGVAKDQFEPLGE